MSRRPPATLADYVLVGINPALIMVLIDSLVFYLLAIFYGGGYDARVMFIFAMFIMGAVAVCRISMEEGAGYAANFGFPLALVALFAINRFGQFTGALAPFSVLINAGIIALIWFLAYKLTWDCTLFDERADTSDQGLLQAAGLEGEQPVSDENAAEDPIDPLLVVREEEPKEELPAWLKWFEPSKRPHAHGMWVIYFSLLALPAFGLGQWFLPLNYKTFGFQMLVIYVASALALLLSTSFLGLRRYLRKRRLEMPAEMTANWLGIGGIVIVVVLAICVLIPRPGAELAVSQLPFPKLGNDQLKPSWWSVGNDGHKKDASARAGSTEQTKQPGGQSGQANGAGNQQSQNGQPSSSGNQQSQNGQSSNASNQQNSAGSSQQNNQSSSNQQNNNAQRGNPQNKSAGQSNQQNSAGNQSSGGQKSNDPMNQSSGQPMPGNPPNGNPMQPANMPPGMSNPGSSPPPSYATQQQTPPPPSSGTPQPMPSPPLVGSLLAGAGIFIKLLIYAAVAALLAFLAWKYRRELAAAWVQLLKELRELWARLFGGRDTTTAGETAVADVPPPPRPFAAYADPFLTGRAGQISRLELLRYTFEALQAWGREHGCPRDASETPHEYAQRLAATAPSLAREAAALSDFYGQAAYAGAQVPATIADPLRSLWHKMGASPVVAASVG
jgi:hypothetical protein